jgi:hypothetical protein
MRKLILCVLLLTGCGTPEGSDVNVVNNIGQSQSQGGTESEDGGGCFFDCQVVTGGLVQVTQTCGGEVVSLTRVPSGQEPVSCVYADEGTFTGM